MSKSAIVKYDLPPYVLVHKIDGRKNKQCDNGFVATEVGTFAPDSVIAVVSRKVGNKISQLQRELSSEYHEAVSGAKAEAHRKMGEALVEAGAIEPQHKGEKK